ncbi:glycosyl transferase [Siphonobacter sp. SORGH_AS_0500]|uniref:macrolide family glycosyltransferase n=1 Tax=Siphonobacter sp. SORGH_AS_0500 TaxID=1864824 RepID=UPI000CA73821|nr:macrolide family glycosyltransferase [Siphonobacter sp. SORGH_AS_0500]PKK35583.1 glycosyl transferase [Siphonobacter sp. SORGH_AS_0500]
MSNVLFLGMPSHGHINPTLGLVHELIKHGEEVTYFASEEFRQKIEATGATFKSYAADLNIFKAQPSSDESPFLSIFRSAETVIDPILSENQRIPFDYMIHSAAFPFTRIISQILRIPAISSLAVFAGLNKFFKKKQQVLQSKQAAYAEVMKSIQKKYGVSLPDQPLQLLLNKSDLNLIYTSRYFIAPEDLAQYDETYRFVGPPVYDRKEDLNFPCERLRNKLVIYISLGTVFGSFNTDLYPIFFQAFAHTDAVVVMAAHQVDLSGFTIPENFIIRDYVPQNALLNYTDVAITHAGMNSISDLVSHMVPFVAIPLGADQPLLAQRAAALGATISLEAQTLTAESLRAAVNRVKDDPSYLENMQKINQSFKEAGGYPKAVEAIFELKAMKGISG